MRSILVAAVAALPLLGCATHGPDWNAIGARAKAIQAACEAKAPDSAVAAERCAWPPIRALYADAGFPDMDVLEAYHARRLDIAARLDNHEIEKSEAETEIAYARKLAAAVAAERQERRREAALTALSMMPDTPPAPLPVAISPPPNMGMPSPPAAGPSPSWSATHNYLPPPPPPAQSPAQRLLECGQTHSCAGAFPVQ